MEPNMYYVMVSLVLKFLSHITSIHWRFHICLRSTIHHAPDFLFRFAPPRCQRTAPLGSVLVLARWSADVAFASRLDVSASLNSQVLAALIYQWTVVASLFFREFEASRSATLIFRDHHGESGRRHRLALWGGSLESFRHQHDIWHESE